MPLRSAWPQPLISFVLINASNGVYIYVYLCKDKGQWGYRALLLTVEAGLPAAQGGAVAQHSPIWRRQVSSWERRAMRWWRQMIVHDTFLPSPSVLVLTQPAYESLGHQGHVPQVPNIRVKVIEHGPVGPTHHATVELCYILTQGLEPGSPTTPLINLRHFPRNTEWKGILELF